MLSKKGSHVGMVLSFVIFITFLVFLYVVIQPAVDLKEDKKAFLENVKKELILKSSEKLISFTITTSPNPALFDCLRIDFSSINTGSNFLIKDKDNNLIDFSSNLNYLDILWTDESFFKIFSSSENFDSVNSPTCNSVETNYNLESVKESGYIFETKILDLIAQYESDYENLKKELKVNGEFGFGFDYGNGTILMTEEKEVATSIYAEKIPVTYVDKEANIKSGFLIVKVW